MLKIHIQIWISYGGFFLVCYQIAPGGTSAASKRNVEGRDRGLSKVWVTTDKFYDQIKMKYSK